MKENTKDLVYDESKEKPRRRLNTMGILSIVASIVAAGALSARAQYGFIVLAGAFVLIVVAFAEAIAHYLRFISVIFALAVCAFGVYLFISESPVQEKAIQAPAQPAATAVVDFDFRNTKWGMSIEDVKRSEAETPAEESDSSVLYGGCDVAGFNSDVYYKFEGDKLEIGAYMINEKHTDYNAYIKDFERCKKALSEVYGAPDKDGMIWSNDLFKDQEQYYGTAVAYGYLSYAASWQTDTTTIFMTLNGDNFEISHTIVYESNGHTDETNVNGL